MNIERHLPELIRRLPRFQGRFNAFELEARGCRVLFSAYPTGTVIPPHRHDTENVGVVTRGGLLLTVGGETKAYPAGEWYRIAAQAEHAAEFKEDTTVIELWFEA